MGTYIYGELQKKNESGKWVALPEGEEFFEHLELLKSSGTERLCFYFN